MRVGCFGGGLNFLLCCVQFAVANVVGDCIREQYRLLRHNTNLVAQAEQGYITQVNAVEQNCAAIRIIKTWNQVDERTFTCTAWPDKGDNLSWLGCERDGLQLATTSLDVFY